jgi:hypothetical protein
MSLHAPARTVTPGLRSAIRHPGPAWPALLTALVYGVVIGGLIASAHGDPAVLITFGHRYLASTRPPPGAPVVAGRGYDGQLYWLWAHDPLLRHPATIARIAATQPAYSLQRVAYPALAWLLAAGRDGALPWTLLIVNLLAVLGLTAGFGVYAQRRGWNPAWALVIGLSPGLLVATSLDLSDVLGATCMLGGLLALGADRAWWAGLLLAVAALSREPMLLAVPAVALELGWRAARALPDRAGAVRLLRRGSPAALLPALAFFGWRAYAMSRPLPHVGSRAAPSLADTPVLPPFRGLATALVHTVRAPDSATAFIVPYVVIVALGILAAVWLLRRGPSAPALVAALYGLLVIPALDFADHVELVRYTMPMVLALLLAGLEQRSRMALGVCAAATAMITLLPLLGAV